MKLLFKKYTILFIFLFLSYCSNGSVGNSINEKNFVLQRFISILNSNTSNIKLLFYFYDDRSDTNLNQFQISSNSNNFIVNLLNSSQLNMDSFSIYLSKSNDPLARNNSKHLGENTVPEITSSASLTEKYYTYSTSNLFRISGFSTSEDYLGSYYKQELSQTLSLPRGSITKGIFTFKPNIQLTINSGSTISINYPSLVSFSVTFNCPISHSGFSESSISIGLKYSDIFKDSGTSKPISEASGGSTNLNSFNTSLTNSSFVSQYNCTRR